MLLDTFDFENFDDQSSFVDLIAWFLHIEPLLHNNKWYNATTVFLEL